MKEFSLTFLGTSACDFSPKLQDEYKNKFDEDARRAACVLFNDRYLIDCGPHCCNSLGIIKKKHSDIRDIFFTHLHSDHFDLTNIRKIARDCNRPLRLWVREDARVAEIPNTEIIRMKKKNRYNVADGMTVTSLSANHDEESSPQWLLFEKNNKKFLYALDGAWYILDTYNYLKRAHLDLVVADATVGDTEGDYRMAEHNSIPMIRLMLPSLKKVEIIDKETKFVLSHIAPTLHKPHIIEEKTAEKMDTILAFDGMKISV